jgi:hypothetical protein
MFGDCARLAWVLADDQIVRTGVDDVLHLGVFMPRQDDEAPRIGADPLVLDHGDRDLVQAPEPIAFADDLERLVLRDGEVALKPLDPLIHLAKHDLVRGLAPLRLAHLHQAISVPGRP